MHSTVQHPHETYPRQPEVAGDAAQSLLASLRALVPNRTVTFTESLRIAEVQAARLRTLLDITDDAHPKNPSPGPPGFGKRV